MLDVDELRARLLDAMRDRIAGGRERGLQVAAYWHGSPIVDVAAGTRDDTVGTPIEPGTLIHSFSTGKGVTATVMHRLAARGLLDYDAPVARYWPAFAARGKDLVTVRQVLAHTAGVPQLPPQVRPADFADWDGMCARIADQPPLWPPGTATGYHGWTFGWILGEIVRRITGRPISTVLRDDITGPLGIADELFFAVPQAAVPRVAPLVDGDWTTWVRSLPDDAPMLLAAPRAVVTDAALGNRPGYLAADIPAAATMTARAVARMYAALLGEVDGVRLLSARHLATVLEPVTAQRDRILGTPIVKALGYFRALTWSGGGPASFGTTGSGGSAAFADPDLNLAVAVTKTRLTVNGPGATAATLAGIVRDAVVRATALRSVP